MKKYAFLTVLLLLFIAFSGCSGSGGDSESEPSNASDQIQDGASSGQSDNNRDKLIDNEALNFSEDSYSWRVEGDDLIIYRDSPENPFIILPATFGEGLFYADAGYDYDAFAGENWVVLIGEVSLGRETTRILLSPDGGATWHETGNLNEICPEILTGAGFFSQEVGFLSYRYTDEIGTPKIYRTIDGGETWERLAVTLPDEFSDLLMTPMSPENKGNVCVYPIKVHDNCGYLPTIYLYSYDGGVTWEYNDLG